MNSDAANTGTRERIIEVARVLFHERGYANTGVAEIRKQADVRSGTLYHFFPSKEALLLAVLDRYVELLMPAVMQPAFATTTDPIERVFAVLAGYRGFLQATGFKLGCPIGNLALEVATDLPAAREKVALNLGNWCKAIQACLDAAGDRFPPDVDRPVLARFVLTVMEGGIMQARAHQRIEPYDDAVRSLRDYFDRMVAQPPAAASTPSSVGK